MVIDSSALLAVYLEEADASLYAAAIGRAEIRLLSAASALEVATLVGARNRELGLREFDLSLLENRIEIVPFTADHYPIARDAWLRYGKGRHPARLNFGDCCAYATAMLAGEPLLFKGTDFAQTDVKSAI